jgi:hypothetical protein
MNQKQENAAGGKNVGWVERSEPRHFLRHFPWWGSLRSTHPALFLPEG